MKQVKKYLMVLALAIAFVLSFAACGSAKDGGAATDGGEAASAPQPEPKQYAGFYSVVIPEDFSVDKYETQFSRTTEDSIGGYDEVITVNIDRNEGTAQEQRDESIEYHAALNNYKAGDDVTFGGLTWKTEYFTWDDDRPAISLYVDLEDGVVVEVEALCMDLDNETFKNFMETIAFVDNPADANWEFKTSM